MNYLLNETVTIPIFNSHIPVRPHITSLAQIRSMNNSILFLFLFFFLLLLLFSSFGGPILTMVADFLNFLSGFTVLNVSASPITVTVFLSGSRTMEAIPSTVAINFITFCRHLEQQKFYLHHTSTSHKPKSR